ncbi:T6SS effector BTH_I2691 family protein [Aeromonas caviae]|uniref:T6SS effector BTH_I2691 family protein n=1 Tax=Aeromonas caviae TaxID=648 RepID=UPI0029DC60DF|nr:T6SS effector BTH_I2691 family protein [Aeromonas caviae]MDX7781361.1 T6SS effector BTH_I2691 family protein [Aeromonas caviae]MDX7891023.1 T6SS effector BTH_I2691 family protein [Aeromonas caviae]MDY7763043.1 T6SS effector BTH_I2691 family protein [Aeromonas caviae]
MSTPNQAAQCANTTDSKSPAGVCPLKNKKIAIIPVRYALDEPFSPPQKQSHPVPAGAGFVVPLKLKESGYALRQLRDGWLYVYDEKTKTFDEYEIKGATFISQSKGSKGHLLYPASHTLSLAYSPQRWTGRIKHEMEKSGGLRTTWMRQVKLGSFASTMKAPHCGLPDVLDKVADLGMSNKGFVLSSTPLAKPAEEDKQGIKLLAHKPASSPTAYKAGIPDPKSAMVVALEDPLADLADLSMKVNQLLAKREALLGKDDATIKVNSHKLMMAEVTRNLARVRLDEKELPASVRGNVARTQAFEEALDDYLGDRYLADMESMTAEPGMVRFNSPMEKRADEKLKILREQYGFNPSQKQVSQWKERAAFQDEVNWSGLNAFIKQYQVPLNELELALTRAHEDLFNGVARLKADPLPFGLDNRTTQGQAYLQTLFAEAGPVLSLSCRTEERKKALEKLLGEKSRDNLLALAPYGFDAALHKGLSELTVDNAWLSTSSGDMTALFGRTADLETLLGDERFKQKSWFQTIEAVIEAMKVAGKSMAKGAHAQIMAAILPHAWKNSLAGNLRLVLLESLLGDQPLQVNRDYRMLHNRFQQKVWIIVKEMSAISSPPPGRSTTVKAINGQLKTLQQQLDTLIASEMPLLVKLKGDLYQQQARQYVGDYLASVRSGVNQRITAMNERIPNLATFGGLVALLNLWNLTVVIAGTAQNAQSIGRERANMQLGSAFAWTGNAIAALYQGAAWEKLKPLTTGGGKRALTAISIKAAIKEGEHAVWVKAFSLRMLAFAGLGAVAAGLEAWDASLASKDPLISEMERTLLASKEYVLWGQTGIFGVQVLLTLVSRGVGGFAIGTVFAPWMVVGLFVLGIAYLVLTVLLNIFKRSDLEKWLLQSTWGKQPANWSSEDELARFELLVNKPGASLTVVRSAPQGWMDTGRAQWQLQLSLPAHLKGQTIGLSVMGQPLARAGQMVPIRSKEDLVRYQAAMKPRSLETQRGRWDEMVYTLPLGIDTNSAIKLELGYLGGMIQRQFVFKGSSNSSGPVTLNGSSGDLGTMPALVVGKQGNK